MHFKYNTLIWLTSQLVIILIFVSENHFYYTWGTFIYFPLQMLPAGDWHCPNCTCKFCGFACWNKAKADNRTGSSLFLCCICEKKCNNSHHSFETSIEVHICLSLWPLYVFSVWYLLKLYISSLDHQSCSEDEVNLSVKSGDAANLFCGKNCQEVSHRTVTSICRYLLVLLSYFLLT